MDIHFFLLPLLFLGPSIAAEPTSNPLVTADSIGASTSTCMSVVFHDFYSTPAHQSQTSISPCDLKNKSAGVFWLGASTNISKDQLLSKHLQIGVPIKNGFNEFMKVEYNPMGKQVASSFPVDVFRAVIATLPYKISYEFIPYIGNSDAPGYYDELVSQVYLKEYDAVVGDISITAARSDTVDFTYQYMEAGVSMIVPTKDNNYMSPWWFMKPLTTTLWLTTLVVAVLKGVLVWFFEREKNPEFQGSPSELIGKILSFSFSVFVFATHEKLESNYSRFIVNLWTFLVFILVTAYAANLTSMLTVEKLQPTITDVRSLITNGDYVGYQNGSFVFELLRNLGFNESKLKPYSTVEQYAHALEHGSSNGGVSAIMDEIPYIRVFLKSHCRKYTMGGRTYRTGGFGFVFPRGSAMVPDISRAVMHFSEGEKMFEMEKKWFGEQTKCPEAGSPISNKSLPLYSLRTIYIITGVASAIALSVYFICRSYKRETRNTPEPETIPKHGYRQIASRIRQAWCESTSSKHEDLLMELCYTISCRNKRKISEKEEEALLHDSNMQSAKYATSASTTTLPHMPTLSHRARDRDRPQDRDRARARGIGTSKLDAPRSKRINIKMMQVMYKLKI